jgi:hypothetical protein
VALKIIRTIIPAAPGWLAVCPDTTETNLSALRAGPLPDCLHQKPIIAWAIEQYVKVKGDEEDDTAEIYEVVTPITVDPELEPRTRPDLMVRDPDGGYHDNNGSIYWSSDAALAEFVRLAEERRRFKAEARAAARAKPAAT